MTKLSSPCPTCRPSEKKGYLWLGGKDYVECPDCGGTGTFIMYEERVKTAPKVFVMNHGVAMPEKVSVVSTNASPLLAVRHTD